MNSAGGTARRHRTREALYEKLRPGPGLAAEQVLANQRARLSGAMIEMVGERGYSGVTVRGLSRLAGVSTKTFYQCFSNVEDCFVTTYARILHDALRSAATVPPIGEDRLSMRMSGFFNAIAAEPKAARLVLVESLSSGPMLARRARVADRALERFIAEELTAAAARTYSATVVHGAAAAALRLARSEFATNEPPKMASMANHYADWLMGICDERFEKVAGNEATVPADPRPTSGVHIGIRDDRRCLLAATAKLSMRDGYEALTVPAIRREAGVSRRSFDENFDGIESCFLAVVEDRLKEAVENASHGRSDGAGWERAAVRAIAALCGQFSRDPVLAKLVLIDLLAPGRSGFELRERVISCWARRLHEVVPSGMRPSRLTAEASVTAAIAMARNEVTSGRLAGVRRIAPEVAFLFLAPTIGSAAAERLIVAELALNG